MHVRLYSSLSWTLVVSFFTTVLFHHAKHHDITTVIIWQGMAASKSREGSTGLQPCKPRDGIVLAGYPFFRHTNPGSAGTRIPGQHTASKPGFVRSVGNGPCVCVLGTLCGHKEVVHDTTMRASSTTFEARAVDNQIQLTISQYLSLIHI